MAKLNTTTISRRTVERLEAVVRRSILPPQFQATSIVYRADRRATQAPNNTLRGKQSGNRFGPRHRPHI